MIVTELNGQHLGQLVELTVGHATVRDILVAIRHEADLIRDGGYFEVTPQYSIGRQRVSLTFMHAGEVMAYENSHVDFPGEDAA